jgi:hypothetical protein
MTMAETTPDQLTAHLAGVREDWDNIGGKPVRHVGRLLAAVEAVLAEHQPADRGRVMNCCAGCEAADVSGCQEWPCPTVEAISRALLGEVPGATA